MKKFVLSCLLLLGFATQAVAMDQCYSEEQFEAEQGIRIHSELMVIGLNCQHMGKRAGHNLYGMYRQFTADHADLFAGYEDTLMDYYNGLGDDGEKRLNALRTRFANKVSEDVAAMRPDVFCAEYAPRIMKAADLSHTDLKAWASTHHDAHPVSKPLCAPIQQASVVEPEF